VKRGGRCRAEMIDPGKKDKGLDYGGLFIGDVGFREAIMQAIHKRVAEQFVNDIVAEKEVLEGFNEYIKNDSHKGKAGVAEAVAAFDRAVTRLIK
jgi:hypothetical protein